MGADVGDLMRLAAAGERTAWEALVDRYEGLVWGVARSHRLGDADAQDVFQTTWLRLVDNVAELRSPGALPGWLATTARHECLRLLRQQARQIPTQDDRIPHDSVPSALDARLLADERDAALWEGFARLPARCQALLRMLAADPPASYGDIAAATGMPVGSIGPTRGRCLEALRGSLEGSRIRTPPAGSH